MLRLINIEEIESLLLLLPNLVRQQEERSMDFARNVKDWIDEVQRVLEANRLHQVGKIASLRCELVAAEQGQVPFGFEASRNSSRSKLFSITAARILPRANEVISAIITENTPRIVEAENISQQIISAASAKGLIPVRDPNVSNTQYLQMFRSELGKLQEFENALIRLDGLVGPYDGLILLDRSLSVFTI